MAIKILILKFRIKICDDDINIKYSLNGNTLNPNSQELLYLKGINEFTIIEATVIDWNIIISPLIFIIIKNLNIIKINLFINKYSFNQLITY